MDVFYSQIHSNPMSEQEKIQAIHPISVGMRLEAIRTAEGMSKAEFSEIIGLNASSYTRMSYGKKPLKAELAYLIAERFEVSMDYLYRNQMSQLSDSRSKKLMEALKIVQEKARSKESPVSEQKPIKSPVPKG